KRLIRDHRLPVVRPAGFRVDEIDIHNELCPSTRDEWLGRVRLKISLRTSDELELHSRHLIVRENEIDGVGSPAGISEFECANVDTAIRGYIHIKPKRHLCALRNRGELARDRTGCDRRTKGGTETRGPRVCTLGGELNDASRSCVRAIPASLQV